jgi:AraC family transcriptional regulator of arabinose operon
MYLPSGDRPFWHAARPSPTHELLYLGWGERQFGLTPCPITRHEGWMYLLVEQGAPTLVTQTARHRIRKGTAVIVGPDHASGWDDIGARSCRVLVWIWRKPATPLLSTEPTTALRMIGVPAPVMVRLESLHALCREEVRLADEVMPLALDGLQRLVEATLMRPNLTRTNGEQCAQRVSLAVRWMESHLQCRQPAVRIADYLGISPSTLHRLFKQEVGRSPDVHFHTIKMVAAKKQLSEGSPVKAVAYGLGYRHPGDFTRAYTRHFGHAPGMERALGNASGNR